MFQYECEKRPHSSSSDTRAMMTAERARAYPSESRSYPSASRVQPSAERARRPLPPRPIVCDRMPTKTTVPLKVWIIAVASCFAVCAVLVLATVAITKWGAEERYSTRELFTEHAAPVYAKYPQPEPTEEPSSEEIDNDIANIAILEKLSLFKNMVANRERKDLLTKPQIHPIHDVTHHPERKIEKKDKATLPDSIKYSDLKSVPLNEANKKIINEFNNKLPEFRPILSKVPEITPENFISNLNNKDYEEYYNDENLYDDYMQSNTMTSYLIEKVQELHDWITKDPDFDRANTTKASTKTEFSHLLRALNDSLVEGNVTIVMNKLRDIYFGDNFTSSNSGRKVILSNSTDLLSFGILTLDIMLLHNIQMMAWESQEAARTKMLKDPDVFAFNALFMDPGKVGAKQAEVLNNVLSKRQNLRQDTEDFDIGKNLFENVLEVGMSAARAAIHLGRAYKNARNILTQLSTTREPVNIQNQISRHIDDNSHALNHLQTSFSDIDSTPVTVNVTYTELDCVWLLYCRNLVATASLNPPFGTMARINGMALRMLSGELAADRALDTMLYEVLTGWTDLKCNDMFPRCSKANAAAVVMNTILQPVKKQSSNRGR